MLKLPNIFLHERIKAKEYDNQKVLFVHEKLDGHRLTVCRQPARNPKIVCAFTSDNIDLWPQLTRTAKSEDIWHWLINFTTLPAKSSIDGELYVPGMPASYVKTAIKQADSRLKFSAFAVPYWSYDFVPTADLRWCMEVCTRHHISFTPFHKLDKPSVVKVKEWLQKAPAETEGYVLKMANYRKWFKIKKRKTLDAFVTDVKPGKGKYEGRTGALICSVYDPRGYPVEICACSGMTDEEREEMSKDDIGRVVEIQYQEIAALGRLRHPIFVRWRDDKRPRECVVSQDLALLRSWS